MCDALLQTTFFWFMQTVANWFSPLAMQDAFALFAGSLVPRVGSLRLFWGMVVRGCACRDLC